MVVVWGFQFVHGGERERERERGGRETKIRGKKDIIIANISVCVV